ncbi:uncharacterized protein ACIB01_006057 [Guaruba guarouba]
MRFFQITESLKSTSASPSRNTPHQKQEHTHDTASPQTNEGRFINYSGGGGKSRQLPAARAAPPGPTPRDSAPRPGRYGKRTGHPEGCAPRSGQESAGKSSSGGRGGSAAWPAGSTDATWEVGLRVEREGRGVCEAVEARDLPAPARPAPAAVDTHGELGPGCPEQGWRAAGQQGERREQRQRGGGASPPAHADLPRSFRKRPGLPQPSAAAAGGAHLARSSCPGASPGDPRAERRPLAPGPPAGAAVCSAAAAAPALLVLRSYFAAGRAGKGGRSRAGTSNPRSPALGCESVGLRPAAPHGRSDARQRLLLQARGPAPSGSGTARLSSPLRGGAQLSSPPSGMAQPGSTGSGSTRLGAARLGLPPAEEGDLPPLEEKETAKRGEREKALAEAGEWAGLYAAIRHRHPLSCEAGSSRHIQAPDSFCIFQWESPGISSFPVTHIPVKKQQRDFLIAILSLTGEFKLERYGQDAHVIPLFFQVCTWETIMCNSLYVSYCAWHPEKYLNVPIRLDIVFMLYDMNGLIFVPVFTFLEL